MARIFITMLLAATAILGVTASPIPVADAPVCSGLIETEDCMLIFNLIGYRLGG